MPGAFAGRLDLAYDFVAGNQRQLGVNKLAVQHMQVGPAHSASAHFDEHLARPRGPAWEPRAEAAVGRLSGKPSHAWENIYRTLGVLHFSAERVTEITPRKRPRLRSGFQPIPEGFGYGSNGAEKTRLRTQTVPDRWIVGVKKDGVLLKRMAHEADEIDEHEGGK